MSVKSGAGTTHVAVKNSNLGMIALIVVAALILPGMAGALGGAALGAGSEIAENTTGDCVKIGCPGNRNKLDKQRAQHEPTTATTTPGKPGMSAEDTAKRQAAKALGDSLPPLPAPAAPSGPGVPTLANPGQGAGGILGKAPVIGGAIEGAVKAIGPGMKAIGK